MKRILCVGAVAVALASAFAIAACSSPGVDTTEYGPPDAGRPDAVYCVSDIDCRLDGASQACGFPVAEACQARGVCVDFSTGPCAQNAPLCGCNGDTVTTCGVPSGYVIGGPTNGQTPTTVDGSVHCGAGSQ